MQVRHIRFPIHSRYVIAKIVGIFVRVFPIVAETHFLCKIDYVRANDILATPCRSGT